MGGNGNRHLFFTLLNFFDHAELETTFKLC
jgi:hypothetical protein